MKKVGAFLLVASTSLVAHDPITTKVTWDREIVPIFEARCVGCHSPAGAGPMSLASYEEARPWARAIREEVLARRMPKWHAVRGYGDFSNDPSLSPFEIALITAWVDGGAPRSAKPGESVYASGRRQSPAVPPARQPPDPPAARQITLPCQSQPLPNGVLLGITPSLAARHGLRLTLQFGTGAMEPLLTVREFDPRFKQTYWLRSPVPVTATARLLVEGTGPVQDCSIELAVN